MPLSAKGIVRELSCSTASWKFNSMMTKNGSDSEPLYSPTLLLVPTARDLPKKKSPKAPMHLQALPNLLTII